MYTSACTMYLMTSISFISVDTLPTLLDDVNGNKDKLNTKSIEHLVRVQDEASESEEPQEDEQSGSEPQLSQKCTYKMKTQNR